MELSSLWQSALSAADRAKSVAQAMSKKGMVGKNNITAMFTEIVS